MAESNVKHTPGPWRLQRGFSDWGLPLQHDVFVGPDESPQQIAGVPSITPYCLGASIKDREYAASQWANAQLIAAAPELLEALKDLLRDAQDRLTEVPDELYHRCREIITRAEGRP